MAINNRDRDARACRCAPQRYQSMLAGIIVISDFAHGVVSIVLSNIGNNAAAIVTAAAASVISM